ncbi:MAG: DUF3386 family protein [Planctomycetaceae bacterium]
MRKLLFLLLMATSCWLNPRDAFAHFLFIRINPQAEAGRSVEVFFSEKAAAGDPRFIDKVAATSLAMQTEPGRFQPLPVQKRADRLRAVLPTSGAVSIDGRLRYGVLTREVPFLLEYFPKAISGDPSTLNSLKPNPAQPVEIVARIEGEAIALTMLQDGKPVPKAKFTTVDDDLANEELEADETGRAIFKPSAPGHYCVYAKVVINTAGELDGTKYTEIRRFPTLAFHWPLIRTDADADAVKLFQQAVDSRAVWRSFPGFTCQVAGSADGRDFTGKVEVAKDGAIKLELDESTASDWVEEQLGSIVLHRQEQPPSKSPPVLQFADKDDAHPLGRLLTFVGGQFASSYRVKDGQIRVVNRNMSDENMTITVLDTTKNADGKYLPHLHSMQTWDAADGRLTRSQTVENTWQRIGGFDLPASVTVSEASSNGGLAVRSIVLSKLHLLKERN